jgi:hypothetical protein
VGTPSEPPVIPKVPVWTYFKSPAARVTYVVGIALIGWWRYEASRPETHVADPVQVLDVPAGALLGPRPPGPDDAGPPPDADIDPARVRVTFGARNGYLLHGKFVPDAPDGGADAGDF